MPIREPAAHATPFFAATTPGRFLRFTSFQAAIWHQFPCRRSRRHARHCFTVIRQTCPPRLPRLMPLFVVIFRFMLSSAIPCLMRLSPAHKISFRFSVPHPYAHCYGHVTRSMFADTRLSVLRVPCTRRKDTSRRYADDVAAPKDMLLLLRSCFLLSLASLSSSLFLSSVEAFIV